MYQRQQRHDFSYSQPSSSQPLRHHGKAGQVSVGQVNLVSSPDCQNNSTFLSGFQHCPSEPGCWELWHRGVEKQLNQTWVSSYRTNASSAFFSSAREKLLFFCFVFFREGVLKERVLKVKKKTLQKRAKTFCVTGWPLQELAKGLRETLAQFRASFFPCDGLKPGVRHILRPLTPWFTSPRNYLCASTPWPPPPKDNVTICLFNCLSVTLLQAFSVGVYGFLFHLYLFIYLAWRGWGLSGPRNRESLFGLVSHGYSPPPPPPLLPLPSIQLPIVRPIGFVWGLEGGWSQGHCTWHFHNHWPINETFLLALEHWGAF